MGKNDHNIFTGLVSSLVVSYNNDSLTIFYQCFGIICLGSGIYNLMKESKNSTATPIEKWAPACFFTEGVMSLITPLVCLVGYKTKNFLLMCIVSF